jgi:hypothetical protein
MKKAVLFAVLILEMGGNSAIALSPRQQANDIIKATGIQGGVVVHVGCGDGTLTAALRINDCYLVQGLSHDVDIVKQTRASLHSLGKYGPVTIDRLPTASLPYVDNSVNLLVSEDLRGIAQDEVMRVLAPSGVAYVRMTDDRGQRAEDRGRWRTIVKPRPAGIDEWTHFLYDASNNAVSHDTAVGMPTHMQWVGAPQLARSHDHLASMSVAVSAGGRIFYIADEGSLAALAFPSKWFLQARDAFNGGITLCRLDALTGKLLSQTTVDHRDPKTGLPPQDTARGVNMPGALPDVLSCDGQYVYMRHTCFDKLGTKQYPVVPHLFCPSGFMDDTWWHRTYWLYGSDMNSGWGGWATAGNQNPSGRLLVMDDHVIYGFGRLEQYDTHGSHVGLAESLLPWPPPKPTARARGTTHYRLFACDKAVEYVNPKGNALQNGKSRGQTRIKQHWSWPMDMVVRAMVLAHDTLFVAGLPELLISSADPQNLQAAQAAYAGRRGGMVRAVSTQNGTTLAEFNLPFPPVLDGMIAAQEKWIIAGMDGSVLCLEGR